MQDMDLGHDAFVGRHVELARVAEVIDRVRSGETWLVSIGGAAGIGKTALMQRGLALTAGFVVLSARADPVEQDLDYGVVRQLVRRMGVEALSAHPLLEGSATDPSPFAVGAQLLALMGEQQHPVAVVVDDVQWADRRSVEALTFAFRRLTVDPVVVVATFRGTQGSLNEPTQRLLTSIEQRVAFTLAGLDPSDVAALADVMGIGRLDPETIRRLHERTGGHALYLQTVLGEVLTSDRGRLESVGVPASLAVAIGGQLAALPAETRAVLEMLAILDEPVPLARLGEAANVASASSAIEPAVAAGLVDWRPAEPSCPVELRHMLQRDAIYATMTPTKRRDLHARAASFVDQRSAWAHRVAALDRADERLAAELEMVAAGESARGLLPAAATHLLWASDISPAPADKERRLLTAATQLMLTDEARGLELRDAIEAAAPSPLRSCVLGTIAFSSGQLSRAEQHFGDALAAARADPRDLAVAALIANRLAGTYILLGQGAKVVELGRWALATGTLDAAADSQTRTLVAIGVSQLAGPREAMAELKYLADDSLRVDPVHIDGLSFRGVFHLLGGDLPHAIRDLSASVRMVRDGATFTLGLRAYFYLALAQYLAGAWDDVELTSEQAWSAAGIHTRHFELPLLHLIAGCVPAGRGAREDAERHAQLAQDAASDVDYGQERLYADMARAVVHQAAADYAGMAEAMGRWHDEAMIDGRSQAYGVLWRPLLVEALIGSGRLDDAGVALERLRTRGQGAAHLQPALAWLEGWLVEQRGAPEEARRIYERGADAGDGHCTVYAARLALAHGRLLRRRGQRRAAVDHLRRAHALFVSLRAAPFINQVEKELEASGLRQGPTAPSQAVQLTSRESETAHLVGRGMTNAEVAAELFITPKAVAYHLGNIYAKLGITGRQQLRRLLEASGASSTVRRNGQPS